MAEIKWEKTYPLKTTRPPGGIFVIGAGGTGSYVMMLLARELCSMEKKPKLYVCDGDNVEQKNLKRQHFTATDVGVNKAEALAKRYSEALGLEIGFKPSFVETVDEFKALFESEAGPTLVITCVDNIKTRLNIKKAIAAIDSRNVYWIDCGNEAKGGQVVLSSRIPGWLMTDIDKGNYPIPDIFDLYKEMIERAEKDKLPSEMSCAELAESSPQYGFINANAAIFAMNYAHALIHKEEIKTHAVIFSIDNKLTHKTLTASNIESWTKFFNRFDGSLSKSGKKFTLLTERREAKELEDKKKAQEAAEAKNNPDVAPVKAPNEERAELIDALKEAIGK